MKLSARVGEKFMTNYRGKKVVFLSLYKGERMRHAANYILVKLVLIIILITVIYCI